jgi:hypothetical protein
MLPAHTHPKAKKGSQNMFNRILCPTDFDGNSLEALRMARGIAEENKARLYVLCKRRRENPSLKQPDRPVAPESARNSRSNRPDLWCKQPDLMRVPEHII